MHRFLSLLPALFCMYACQPKPSADTDHAPKTVDLHARADSLAHAFIITDTHVDLPYRLRHLAFNAKTDQEVIISTDDGDFDYQRAKQGGLDAPFMSIYIPSSYQTTGGAKELADSLIDMVESIASTMPDKFALAKSPEQVRKNFEAGLISLPMGMENGAPIEGDLKNISYFHDRGIRYITLTHAKDNKICDSSYDTTRTWNGLSPFGRAVVKEMNRVGIMVDVSHVSDSTFYQVLRMTDVPVIASHSSCRHFTEGFERNMTDEMIRMLGEKNGVIQINFGSTFLDEQSRDAEDELDEYMKENNLSRRDSTSDQHIQEFLTKHHYWTNVSRVADHIDHVVEIAGIDHVGIGSDFDGVGNSLPEGLKDVSMYPNLIEELIKRGYTDEDIEKVCYKNAFRVWSAVENAAGRQQQ